MNTITPRIFIAATQQNDGKTTTALGLFKALSTHYGRVGFIKPVGQRFVDVEGKRIDEDSVLIDQTFNIHCPLEAMSPIAVEPEFTRRYINNANHPQLVERIHRSFDRTAWEKDFVIIEGTGHAGVGSVFDLSNARVARLLQSQVLLVAKGGIGRPIDEVALNQALFDKEGVEIVGVILNKILPEKFEYVVDFAKRGLERLGLNLVGAIPEESLLAHASLGQIARTIKGTFINAREKSRRRVKRVVIGAMNSEHVIEYFQQGTLVITPGDRADVILAALSTTSLSGRDGNTLAGMILSGDLLPEHNVRQLIEESDMPVIATSLDSYAVASAIHTMTVKTLPGDQEKIDRIQHLFERHVQLDHLIKKLCISETPTEAPEAP